MDEVTEPFFQVVGVAELVNAWYKNSLETNYVGSSPSIGIYVFLFGYFLNSRTLKLWSNTSIIKLYVSEVIFAPLAGLEVQVTHISVIFLCVCVCVCVCVFVFNRHSD